ncbi:MAG: hypothetical protein JJ884_03965 [Maricaulis sp.]|uniref:SDH family Clp fold serine proteinase n=1 Tax=Maricaulis sp. TaxID=1486257 RepID=UPI001B1EB2C9|nr:hypothetical protein [Maricaulis sp.]MBO6730470.1 hypothetical protein [Maricaulis sp.]MBO6846652.1 hypothetical protein [Maricaulis sp.]MBO6877764.1 hypothetical protein [Maricaulis sp.]
MVGLVTGIGLVGWGGIASIGGLIAGTLALQQRMRNGRMEREESGAETRNDAGMPSGGPGGELSPYDAYKLGIERKTAEFSAARQSTVIKIVHHDPNEYVDHDTAVDVIDVLRKAGPDARIDVILHTPGGISSATQQILHALLNHKGPKTAFVPYRAKSAGTMIALACDEIVMGPSAVLGPIDPQYSWLPAHYLAELPSEKSADRISDEMLVLSKMAKQAMKEARRFACEYVNDAHKKDGTCSLTDDLIGGGRNHDYPILPDEAKEFGLKVRTNMPEAGYGICQPPPKDEPFLIVSMFNTEDGEKIDPAKAPKLPLDRNGFRLDRDGFR